MPTSAGTGEGEGYNLNYPMRFGTDWDRWSQALEDACGKLVAYNPDVVVVSLGVDTFEKDPISKFKLKTEDFPKIGERIARLEPADSVRHGRRLCRRRDRRQCRQRADRLRG
jgi:acetoin utilization deacetylase AcuC-like enzyme